MPVEAVRMRFEFNTPMKVYFSRQRVRVKTYMVCTCDLRISCVSISFHGHGETQWEKVQKVETPEGVSRRVVQNFSGHEEYFRENLMLLGRENGPEMLLNPGEYLWEAEYQLPVAIPSSFKHKFGEISYQVRVCMFGSNGLQIKDYAEEFTVISTLELSRFPHLMQAVSKETKKTFGCCCWESEPISLSLLLPCSGFVFDDPIPITIEIRNKSDVDVLKIKVELLQELTFQTRHPARDIRLEEEKITELEFPRVRKYQNKVYEGNIVVPADKHVLNLSYCSLIEVYYRLRVTMIPEGCFFMVDHVEQAITFGTTPFEVAPSAPLEESSTPVVEQPLPSYEQVIKAESRKFPLIGRSFGWGANRIMPSEMEIPPPSFDSIQKSSTGA